MPPLGAHVTDIPVQWQLGIRKASGKPQAFGGILHKYFAQNFWWKSSVGSDDNFV
jgi:hypothetical protein